MDFTFGGKYRLEEKLAIGGCGTVFYGVHTVAGKEVAIKVEPAITKDVYSPLRQESKIYRSLMGGPGVPWIIWSGRQGDYNVMVIDLLGPSLEDLFKMCNRHFSLKTVLLLADQLISRLEFIHTHDLVHRDIKPANFVMGTSRAAHLVNVIDFGLAKKYRDARTGVHIPYHQDTRHGVGTSLFASLNTHLGIECSPRDDLESLSYMLIYFLRGTLPWRKLKAPTVAATWEIIRDAKLAAQGTLTNKLQFFGPDVAEEERVVPDLMVFLNPIPNMHAIRECAIEHVPTIGVVDSNVDPRIVMYPIPANDESTRTAELIAGVLSIAGREGIALKAEVAAARERRMRTQDRARRRAAYSKS
ncbi:hypothetical protein EWM64_g6592 [Hericium alpestre]|uniref:non-specific serine/threonine protein kinase n=1 Tax=Hericium alpestre TaxID=135208 RepID=A0A4Y9ZVA7_9AGAM|nr:hypothetical protein EWM64_g6592 [Hericium alpestre]